jgi:hypothetical protein
MSQEPSGAWTVLEYTMDSGHSPVREFLGGLTGRHKEETLTLLAALREHGAMLRPLRSKLVETGCSSYAAIRFASSTCFGRVGAWCSWTGSSRNRMRSRAT